jgi:small subunit ribosomal protein S15
MKARKSKSRHQSDAATTHILCVESVLNTTGKQAQREIILGNGDPTGVFDIEYSRGLDRVVTSSMVVRMPVDTIPAVRYDIRQDGRMSITKERKTEIIQEFRRADADTGSPEVQIAMLTHRINELTNHLTSHAKDHASRRGLLMLVSRRRRLLDYLRRHHQEAYLSIIGRLSLRK